MYKIIEFTEPEAGANVGLHYTEDKKLPCKNKKKIAGQFDSRDRSGFDRLNNASSIDDKIRVSLSRSMKVVVNRAL